MPLRITSWKHFLNALLEFLTNNTEIMHMSKAIYIFHHYSKIHNPTFENKKKKTQRKVMKMRQDLTRSEAKRLFWRIQRWTTSVIRTPNDIHPLKERNKMHLKLKEVVCVLLFTPGARKPVMIVSEAGYSLCPEPVLWQLLGLLSEVAFWYEWIQFWYAAASASWMAWQGKDQLTLHEKQAEHYKNILQDS